MRGVKRSSVCAFDMKLCASPVSDHLSYGSGEQYALLWDLQEKKYRNNSRNVNTSISTDYYPYPKFVLGGHTSEVSVAQFSCGSRYIASIDDSICRLWQFDRSLVEKRSKSLMKTNGFEQIEYYSLPHSQGTASQMEKLCVTPVDSPSAKRKAPIKSPFTSPFKSAPNSGRYLNAERSPVKKISK
ncbi:unnamed protein product [Anisakis simplex]|uniref:Uncharacterized protein n=1 Tax=Anisakis simplex TaxID=6269 RepID=A0A3P6N5E8_ANISI|nr:unnamed protein product [Anisakis simplex]